MSSTHSAKRSARSAGGHSTSSRIPASEVRLVPPAPMPRSSRPPLRSSIALTVCAVGSGWRKLGEVTSVPMRIREVSTAAAASVAYASCHGVMPRQATWS
jgi:hypothetical protein